MKRKITVGWLQRITENWQENYRQDFCIKMICSLIKINSNSMDINAFCRDKLKNI